MPPLATRVVASRVAIQPGERRLEGRRLGGRLLGLCPAAVRRVAGRTLGVSRRGPRRRSRLLALLCLIVLTPALVGCGPPPAPPYYGFIVVDNRTDTTTDEILHSFFLSPFGRPWTGDLLGGDLFPLETRSVGVWHEDYYDAEGDMELGDVILWFDIFVGEGATTVFEVF